MKITKETSYMIGLSQTDGHLHQGSRDRGRFVIELSDVDSDIIYKIAKFIPYNYTIFKRSRKTNFSDHASSIGLRVCNQEFRKWINESGIPYGKKSLIVEPPLHLKQLSIDDYVRGLWDGDGSVGHTKTNRPFVSFTTNSEKMKLFLENYISKIVRNNNHHFTKPKRDNVFNIMVTNEDAAVLASKLYPSTSKNISIKRKFINAQKVKTWKRPKTMKQITWKRVRWTQVEDEYLLKNGIRPTMNKYSRTLKSVNIRLWRLTGHC
jgi:hypothetical protein